MSGHAVKKLKERLEDLGITEAMVQDCKLPLYDEADDLVDAGEDMYGRRQKMTGATCRAWQDMQSAAVADGIELKLVSAYRSVSYQCDLIQNKLDQGRSISDILSANAIPGHSEHHTGRALDLHAGEGEPLEQSFEQHPAYEWLTQHAGEFGFHLSYPKDNPEGIDFEPWHWCFRSEKA